MKKIYEKPALSKRGTLGALAADADLRATLGAANRDRAARDYAEKTMVAAYAALYGEALASPA